MLSKNRQLNLSLSPYSSLYDILIQKDNMWRRINEEVDFSFVRETIGDTYSEKMGRTAIDPVFMFKLTLLKTKSGLSDRGLIKMVEVNMEYKYFLGLDPEETEIIDPSSLTKFRRMRVAKYDKDENGNTVKIIDNSELLLDKLVSKTVDLAITKGILKKKNIGIVDSTHTLSMYGHVSPREKLIQVSKKLRKDIYKLDGTMHDKMPKKKEASGLVEDEIEYCKELIKIINNDGRFVEVPHIEEDINYLNEIIEDTEIELEYSKDQDAKIGHKTADTEFFGYKTHIMMSEERIVTAASITTGEKHDGKQLKNLIEKAKENGIELEAIVGDGAYSEKDNLEYCENNDIKNVSKLSAAVLHGNRKTKEFEFNKDAGMYVCPAGNMAIKKAKQGSQNEKVECYYFDVEKCKHCPFKNGCYKEGAKSKTYSVKIKSETHTKQMDYMETEEFKEYYSHRYKIEAKNAEIKSVYNYEKSTSCGLSGMTLQGATTLFLANLSRIYRLEDKKRRNIGK